MVKAMLTQTPTGEGLTTAHGRLAILLVLASFPFFACAAPEEAPSLATAQPGTQYDGVFEYMVEGSQGLSFYQDGYFVHFLLPEGVEVPESGLTDALVAGWWAGANLESGTYTVSGDTTTCTFLFHRDPARVGESFRWVGEYSGDTLTWQVLDEVGAVRTVGRSLRLR